MSLQCKDLLVLNQSVSNHLHLLQGQFVHTLHHATPTKDGASLPGDKPPIIYSLSWHPTKPCLLTAGSRGPVRVWKPPGWKEEEDE